MRTRFPVFGFVPIEAPSISPKRAVGITALFLLFQVGLGAGLGGFVGLSLVFGSGSSVSDIPFAALVAVANTLATLCIFNLEARRQKTPWRSWPPSRVSVSWLLAPTLLITVGNLVLTDLPSRLLNALVPAPDLLDSPMAQLFDLLNYPFIAPFALMIVAPITEETIFRGRILSGLLRTTEPRKAILITATLFSIMHLNLWQLPATFMIGLTLGFVYYRTGSVLLCILGHALHNGIAMLYIANSIAASEVTDTPMFPATVYLTAVAVLSLGIWLIIRLTPPPPVQVPPPLPV